MYELVYMQSQYFKNAVGASKRFHVGFPVPFLSFYREFDLKKLPKQAVCIVKNYLCRALRLCGR